MMINLTVFFVFLLTFSCQGLRPPVLQVRKVNKGHFPTNRIVRSIPTVVKSLLKGARPGGRGNNNRTFVKKGSFEDAKRDFFAANPTEVKVTNKGSRAVRFEGKVGEFTLLLRLSSRYVSQPRPSLSIKHPDTGYYEKIMYKEKSY